MSKPKSTNVQMSEHERALFSEKLAHQASVEAEQEVPDWHRAQAFEQHFETEMNKTKGHSINWGLWLGVPSLSMVCSAVAITIVMTFMQDKGFDQQAFDKQVTAIIDQQVQQKVTAQLTSTLANKDNTDIERLVNLKLREFAAEQQVILANYRTDLSMQQQSNNLALAGYVIGASRKERKEDMSDFISFLNAQRQDEQLTQKIKFQQLEREISLKNIGLEQSSDTDTNLTKPVNYKG
ncbi:hypothetical protein ESZ36_13905 [Colwellia demingiae]|uniref:Uncharacterized protein n=1 Tax=Colwellia demingiae TaxID=89401 RepID=A0A5C6QEF3_9GAMM|nr:hypothetical protein [Colwellia demingiae]TWX67384.1 hypothetical protein ESZ36_13905 [Colwellia demingiae]